MLNVSGYSFALIISDFGCYRGERHTTQNLGHRIKETLRIIGRKFSKANFCSALRYLPNTGGSMAEQNSIDRARTKMSLAVQFHPTGHHVAACLDPKSQLDAGNNAAHYLDLARTAERGKFDLIFLADLLAIRRNSPEARARWPQYMAYFEPLTLLSAMSAVTDRIGLVSTASASYTEPFNLARYFASLDHLSSGRAGWNVVTSTLANQNFGHRGANASLNHDELYNRANEFVDVVRGLWDSWDDDAFIRDRTSGRYLDPNKMHTLNHRGAYYSVEGPLHLQRPPQGHPVLFQAGTSDTGMETAARVADVVFVQEKSLEKCRAIRQEIH
jgi:FMN-dependent oxidoreductase (nitrilotriacetate monooxygenase family)